MLSGQPQTKEQCEKEDDDDDDDDEVCPEYGYTLVPAMIEGVGKSLVECKRCPDDDCAYNS